MIRLLWPEAVPNETVMILWPLREAAAAADYWPPLLAAQRNAAITWSLNENKPQANKPQTLKKPD